MDDDSIVNTEAERGGGQNDASADGGRERVVAHGAGSARPGSGNVETPTAFDDWDEEAPISPGELNDLFLAIDKATRARRLYQENNPVYQSFHANLKAAFGKLWDRVPTLTLTVQENAFRCFGQEFVSREGREGLPFLFYRDGVRMMTFLPGFEDEIDRFLGVVDSARHFGPKASDDIVTLLWEEEFSAFQYSYVDLLAEQAGLPTADASGPSRPPSVDRERLERIVEGEEPEEVPPSVQAGAPPVAAAVTPENFVETAYFLEPEEVDLLQREVDIEWNRDVRGAVLDALFDRLEDLTVQDRHSEIMRILGQLLPAFLGRGDLTNATKVVVEVGVLIESGHLSAEDKSEGLRLLRELNDPQVLSGFLASLEDGTIDPSAEQLGTFLSYLGAEAMPLLLRTAERTDSAKLKERMWPALDAMGKKYPRALASQVLSPDLAISYGGARLSGRVRLFEAKDVLVTLFRKADASGRRVAVEALAAIGDAGALASVQEALSDDDRDVRIAAARALANAGSAAAHDRLRAAVHSKTLREADLTEKIAFFEAFGAVAGPEDVDGLDRMLNGRRLLGRETPEMRACAAMALGRISTPDARASLQKAADDPHPMVRNAVNKALEASRRRP